MFSLIASSLSPVAVSAQTNASTEVMLSPVGYNLIDGHVDYQNPITDSQLTRAPGFSSTDPYVGSDSLNKATTMEMVINGDDRVRISNTHDAPYRQLGLIGFTTPEGKGICTGALISKDTVLTAGHCVTPHRSNITFTPGRNQDEQPFGVIAAKQVWHDKNYGKDGYDWGIIKLASPIGDKIGWLGMHTFKPDSFTEQSATIIGYPNDKLKGTLWKDQNIVTKVTEKQVYYATDTFSGQSGAPVLDKHASIYAIHTNGNSQQNWGTLLNADLFNVAVNLAHSSMR